MSRQFGVHAGNDEYITFAPGNLSGVDGGPISVLAMVKPTGAVGGVIVGLNGVTDVWYMLWDSFQAFVRGDFTGGPVLINGEWQLIGYSKASGSSTVRWHHYPFESGGWSHSNGASVGDGTGPVTSVRIGLAVNRTIGLIAAEAVWSSQLNDASFEAAGATAMTDWLALSPSAAWQFNQASTAISVPDLTGGGANQTAIQFTEVSADNPPGWTYLSAITGTAAAGLGPVSALGAGELTAIGEAIADLGALNAVAVAPPVDHGPTPIMNLEEIATTLLACLCESAAVRPAPPQHCCFRVGEEIAHDADIFSDLCCEGLAYVTLLDIYPVVDSFPEQSIVTQANQVCSFPSWAVSLKMGIVRCAPVGTDETMPTCADWNAAAFQGMFDAQSLASAACCFKAAWLELEPGLSVVIGPNSTTTPQGGCVERFVAIQVQTTVCPAC